MSKRDYEVLCYRIMCKQLKDDEWQIIDLTQEEEAIERYRLIKMCFNYSKMLKIQTFID